MQILVFATLFFLKMFAQNKTRTMHTRIILLSFALLVISAFTYSFIRADLELLFNLASLIAAINKQIPYRKILCGPQLCNGSRFVQRRLVLCSITLKLRGLYHTAWPVVVNTFIVKVSSSILDNFLS